MMQLNQQGSRIATWKDTSPSGEKVIVSNLTTGQEVYIKTQYTDSTHVTIKYSLDGSEYTTVYDNVEDPRYWSSTDSADGTSYYIGTLGTDANSAAQYFHGSIDFSKSYVRLSSGLPEYLATDTTETITLTSETSKPGLWISNFIYPVYGDGNGSYLEHNKVHSNEGSFNKFNSDVIGNYSYSFIQRGKFTKYSEANWDNGCDTTYWQFTPNNYNIHYSPNIHSCMAYPSLQISNPKFGQIYTTYQTIATPSDPDMQKYQESNHKCITFDNREYSNSESVTKYAARLVGKDWSYELTFNGNGFGSGNDYGNGGHPDNDNGSNGGCVTGTITYTDSVLGTTCTQEINSCFQTDQSFFNPDVPDIDSQPLGGDDTMISQSSIHCNCVSGYPWGDDNYDLRCDNSVSLPRIYQGRLILGSSSPSGYSQLDSCWTNAIDFSKGECRKCGHLRGGQIYAVRTSAGSWKPGEGENPPNITTDYISTTVYYYNPSQPQTKVNIYMNIYDLKVEAEDLGLPWTGGCGEARFTVEFSITKCDKPGCTSRLIASNVDINSLGDISKLNNIVITG